MDTDFARDDAKKKKEKERNFINIYNFGRITIRQNDHDSSENLASSWPVAAKILRRILG
ncbi:hypothetical protein [Azospirillum soli]|uniref:hypothetical protein n=1 Tax=Azospirillum soli TaxID=1304799 RepID=UPI001AE5BE91|nr:hypothetical protein [Azospirillum soli]MBP2316278.1 hypothetical protein [Azospirillum soli]